MHLYMYMYMYIPHIAHCVVDAEVSVSGERVGPVCGESSAVRCLLCLLQRTVDLQMKRGGGRRGGGGGGG